MSREFYLYLEIGAADFVGPDWEDVTSISREAFPTGRWAINERNELELEVRVNITKSEVIKTGFFKREIREVTELSTPKFINEGKLHIRQRRKVFSCK